MFYQPFRKVLSYLNVSATVIVGTNGKHVNDYSDYIKQHVSKWLRQQLTRPRRSQPHRSRKRKDTKPECDSAIGQHLLENDQCALNYDNKWLSILATARSSFLYKDPKPCVLQAERACLHSHTHLIITGFLFGLLLRFLKHFAIAKSFFGALYNTSAIIGSS